MKFETRLTFFKLLSHGEEDGKGVDANALWEGESCSSISANLKLKSTTFYATMGWDVSHSYFHPPNRGEVFIPNGRG